VDFGSIQIVILVPILNPLSPRSRLVDRIGHVASQVLPHEFAVLKIVKNRLPIIL
jgi:hypothetical protein